MLLTSLPLLTRPSWVHLAPSSSLLSHWNDFFGCESSPISRNLCSSVSPLDKFKIRPDPEGSRTTKKDPVGLSKLRQTSQAAFAASSFSSWFSTLPAEHGGDPRQHGVEAAELPRPEVAPLYVLDGGGVGPARHPQQPQQVSQELVPEISRRGDSASVQLIPGQTCQRHWRGLIFHLEESVLGLPFNK